MGASNVLLSASTTIENKVIEVGVVDITTNDLIVTSGTSFGAISPLDVNATTASVTGIGGSIALNAIGTGGIDLTIATTATGDIELTGKEYLTLSNISAFNGAITVDATGAEIFVGVVTSVGTEDGD